MANYLQSIYTEKRCLFVYFEMYLLTAAKSTIK